MERFKIIFILLIPFFLLSNGFTKPFENKSASEQHWKVKDVIVHQNTSVPIDEREAILILPGVGDSQKGRKRQKEAFSNIGYDLYIPDYLSRMTVQDCVNNLSAFIEKHNLKSYKKVHVIAYIMGAWVINSYLNINTLPNLASIVYDRSPLQERAPQLVVDKIPMIGNIMFGTLIEDLVTIPYQPISNDNVKIGLVVESTATNLVKFFKKKTLSYGDLDWKHFNQPHNDIMFTYLNHKQMYYRIGEISKDILYFFEYGVFPKDVPRVYFGGNPFKRHKAKKLVVESL